MPIIAPAAKGTPTCPFIRPVSAVSCKWVIPCWDVDEVPIHARCMVAFARSTSSKMTMPAIIAATKPTAFG